jgi:hypothetical protein
MFSTVAALVATFLVPVAASVAKCFVPLQL